MFYLASPYSAPERSIMDWRFHQAAAACAHFMRRNVLVYSPIVHNHYLASNFDLPHSWDFWAQLDIPMLTLAQELWVLALPGHTESRGVRAETEHASLLGKPIKIIRPEEVCGENYQYC